MELFRLELLCEFAASAASGYWLCVRKSDGHCSGEIVREKERGVQVEEFLFSSFVMDNGGEQRVVLESNFCWVFWCEFLCMG